MRTAKPCGPDAPTLAFKSRGSIHAATVARKPGHRGERGISRKPLRGGCRAFSGELAVNTRVHSNHYLRTRGCGCTGHPAFPTPSKGADDVQASGALRLSLIHISEPTRLGMISY